MSGWRDRLLVEKTELDGRMAKLCDFIKEVDGPFQKLSEVDQDLLRRQHDVMHEYSDVLRQRIERSTVDESSE